MDWTNSSKIFIIKMYKMNPYFYWDLDNFFLTNSLKIFMEIYINLKKKISSISNPVSTLSMLFLKREKS